MEAKYSCNVCNKTFHTISSLKRHKRLDHPQGQYACLQCDKTFARPDNLKRHMNRHNDERLYSCDDCHTLFCRPDSLKRHRQVQHGYGKRSNDEPDAKQPKISKLTDHYKITHIKDKYSAKFQTTSQYYKVTFKDLEIDNLPEIMVTLHRMFDSIMEQLMANIEPHHLVQLSVQSPGLDYPITLPFKKRTNMTAELFLSEVERVLQSFEEFVLDEGVEISITHVNLPEGRGKNGKKRVKKSINLRKYLKNKTCVIQIRNNDDLCCARAIVVAKTRLDKHEKWNSIRQGRKIQRDLAIGLHREAGVPLKACGIEEVKQFQAVLPNYQIHVLSKDEFDTIIYCGPDTDKKIYLYYHNGHYDVVTSLPAFLNTNYFCHTCKKPYHHKKDHKCVKTCGCCFKEHTDGDSDPWIKCDKCKRYFKGEVCYKNHSSVTAHGNSVCLNYNRCEECGKVVDLKKNTNHRCGELYCKTCREYVLNDHKCFMKPAKKSTRTHKATVKTSTEQNTDTDATPQTNLQEKDIVTYIFFDYECCQDSGIHHPNLCVAQKVCELCLANEQDECEHCGIRQHVFYGKQSSTEFCQWLFSGDNSGAVCICHNFKAYDSYFILQYLYDNSVVPSLILNGTKVMTIDVPKANIKFIDSINFVPMALSKLPATFGLTADSKEYFPHLFNSEVNQNVKLPNLPDASFYNPDAMKTKDRQKFYKWYDEHKNDPFDLQTELLSYCENDVNILRRCALKFRELFIDMTQTDGEPGIDPFQSTITIAAACNLVYRTKFLQPETVAIIPPVAHSLQTHSLKAMSWIKYVSGEKGVHVKHARNGGEVRIGPYLVDGYYEQNDEKVCLEFNGCIHHACPRCYSKQTTSPINGRPMEEIYQQTLDKQKYIESQGYTLHTMWECTWNKQIQDDVTTKNFVKSLNIVPPLEPRDAFFGGRTEAYTLYRVAEPNETIKYVDYTSLYPFVNKTCKYPLGHPTQITENFTDIDDYEGLVKCKILPPRNLYMPVLPARINGKLMFTLCRSCTEQQHITCEHNDEERALTGTWVTDEVKKAVEMGYRTIEIYEVWHFDEVAQYDTETKEGGLFTEYINTFLKMKQEASGFPDWANTETKKQEYIRQYEEREGIRLEYDNIKHNPGLRALAKLMLNSMWGKLGQRSNLPQTSHFTNPTDYYDLMTSEKQEVHSVRFVNDSMIEAQWSYKEEFATAAARTNVVLAAYTTTHARLKLYELLETLGERVLYVDTDSCIYTHSEGQTDIPVGDYLGDLVSEVGTNSIQTFISGGCKNYAFRLANADNDGNFTQCKVRGITLNFANSRKINIDTMQDIVQGLGPSSISIVDKHKIARDKATTNIVTKTMTNTYKLVFDKRVIKDNYKTVPYGYESTT